MKKISIVTVVYNGEDTIEKTIESVAVQKDDSCEYIIIDGDSHDRTNEIINRYFGCVDTYVSEPDCGIYDAMNKGIELATGEIIAFLNSGDWYQPDSLKTVIQYFDENDIDLLIGRTNLISDNEVAWVAKNCEHKIELTMNCCHQAVFAKRSLFDQIGKFNLEYSICADYEWILLTHLNNFKTMYAENIMVNYLTGGISEKHEVQMLTEMYEIAKKQALLAHDYERIKEITEYYEGKLTFQKKEARTLELIDSMDEIVYSYINRDEKYYIWGCGVYGNKCLKYLSRLGIIVEGFIDSYAQQESFMGFPVRRPDKIKENYPIFISSIKYREEIETGIKEMGITNCVKSFVGLMEYGNKEERYND